MSTLDAKPSKKKALNSKLLPIAAILLIVLALLFMATPLLRTTRPFQGGGNFVVRSGQTGQPNAFPAPGGGTQTQTLPGQGGTNFPTRRLAIGGAFGPILYFVMLIIALAAGLGMLFLKRWGQVLGIIMAVLYALLGLVSLLPLLFARVVGLRNPLSIILGLVHVLLAIAVIVLASIPARQPPAPAAVEAPPAATA